MKKKILFVCLGNICRSPAAEEIMRVMSAKACLDGISVDSAGTSAYHSGELPDGRMRQAAAARGYKLTSCSRQLKENDFEKFDMIIVMDDSNYERAHRLAPDMESARKIYRMTDFCRKDNPGYVPDPYYEGNEGFEKVLDILEDACEGLIEDIKG